MKRIAYQKLIEWKFDKNRKPLIIQGAGQVGKTYLITEFGKHEYEKLVYLNFEQEPQLASIFDQSLNPDKIIENIGLYFGEKVTSEKTLLFFDEIQTVPKAITSLKYFQEQSPEFHVVAAGSLLGVSVGLETSFPVGKVNFLNIYPMTFQEFLMAIGEELLAIKITELSISEPFQQAIHVKLLGLLKLYLFLGGMPEVIGSYVEEKDIRLSRKIQTEILEAYQRDFSKYANKNQAIKISEFYNSIPKQLAKENKKFKFADIKKNARSSNYEQTIEWLKKAGLITLVYHLETPKLPLSSYADFSKFKVYLHDVGLLAAFLNISSDLILDEIAIFSQFKGAFIENFISQELSSLGMKPLFYWTSRSEAEVDFIISSSKKIYPVEVKSGQSKNLKSLRSYSEKYNPELIFRISPRNLSQSNDFINLPLYANHLLKNYIES